MRIQILILGFKGLNVLNGNNDEITGKLTKSQLNVKLNMSPKH